MINLWLGNSAQKMYPFWSGIAKVLVVHKCVITHFNHHNYVSRSWLASQQKHLLKSLNTESIFFRVISWKIHLPEYISISIWDIDWNEIQFFFWKMWQNYFTNSKCFSSFLMWELNWTLAWMEPSSFQYDLLRAFVLLEQKYVPPPPPA